MPIRNLLLIYYSYVRYYCSCLLVIVSTSPEITGGDWGHHKITNHPTKPQGTYQRHNTGNKDCSTNTVLHCMESSCGAMNTIVTVYVGSSLKYVTKRWFAVGCNPNKIIFWKDHLTKNAKEVLGDLQNISQLKWVNPRDFCALDRAITLYTQGVSPDTISNQEPTLLICSPPEETFPFAFIL